MTETPPPSKQGAMIMTDEELDIARAREVIQTTLPDTLQDNGLIERALIRVAMLARTGWKPVDPDLLEAREVVAKDYDRFDYAKRSEDVRGEKFDQYPRVSIALAAIKRGRELAREGR